MLIKYLGLTIDAQLSWSKHVDEICKKAFSAIGALRHVRPVISTDVAVQIYNALILPHCDYCSPVWDCMSGYLNDKLQKLQNRAARAITKSPFDTRSNLLLGMLKWENLSLRRKKQKALIMYKTLKELAPEYLQCLFTQRHVNDYNLRNLEGKLSLPKPNSNYLKQNFCYSGACLWNNLPQDLKSAGSIGQFKLGTLHCSLALSLPLPSALNFFKLPPGSFSCANTGLQNTILSQRATGAY